ncbi:MAG TPA: rRNA maturation RNase YbeY [Dehalococcoidales bacterium]|nr:rRNA maturation RNase YbeY [Dehalococcoidales bacterium]
MEINVLIEEGIEVEPPPEWMQKIIEATLLAENAPGNSEISLVITGQERIQELNREYRGQDQPTDVLSFSLADQNESQEDSGFLDPPDGLLHLGEVIISYPQVLMQAEESRHSTKKEMASLIIHGVLHILGYDHAEPHQEPAMKAREDQILSELRKELL